MPLRHRHGYHAALHRGLPAGTASPAQEFLLRDEGARRTAPGPDPPGSSRSVIKGRMTPVPLVLLSVMLPDPHHLAVLARPGPVGAACHPPRHLPVQAAPSFLTPTASGAKAKVSHLHSNHSASRRTAVFTNSPLPMLAAEKAHRAHAIVEQVIADLKNGPLAHLPSGTSGPTAPGWSARRWRSTSPAPPAPWPRPSMPKRPPARSARNSSPSRRGWPARPDA